MNLPERGEKRGPPSHSSPMLRGPDNAILLACMRPDVTRETWRLALEGVQDWGSVPTKLRRHRLTLLFLRGLRDFEEAVPPPILAALREEANAMLYGNLILGAEGRLVGEALASAGVRALHYKGASLARAAWGSIALRPFSDVDVVVSPTDISRALGVLSEIGYSGVQPSRLPTETLRRWRQSMAYEMPLQCHARGTIVDLHWNITAPFEGFPFDFDELWRSREQSEDGATLGREELIVALCFHGLKHCWWPLESLGSLLQLLLKDGPLNWARIEDREGQVTYLGLAMARQLCGNAPEHFDSCVPASVRAHFPALSKRCQMLWRALESPEEPQGRELFLQRLKFGALARKGAARSQFILGMVRLGAVYVAGKSR